MKVGTPYKRSQIEDHWDTIVVGSGIGGLVPAALLARHTGRRVLVLEQHYAAGGFTHTFERPGFEWDVGVHYVGEVQRGQAMRQMFDHVTDGELDWADMGDVYDRIIVSGRRYDLVKGKAAWTSRMKDYFPGHAREIDRYVSLVTAAHLAMYPFFAERTFGPGAPSWFGRVLKSPAARYARRTTAEVLSELTDNLELRAVLAGQWGNTGLPPGECSFLLHAVMVHHYFEGGGYPVGGSARIAQTIERVIAQHGGRIVTSARVDEILVRDGRAQGVRMADGRVLFAREVISDAGVLNTVTRLLPAEQSARCGLAAAAQGVEPSSAHVSLYLGFDQPDAELGVSATNLWICPDADHDGNVRRFQSDPDAPIPLSYASFATAKDPLASQRLPGKSCMEVMTLVPHAWFEPWRDTRWKKRGPGYEAFKESLGDRLLDALCTEYPQLRDRVAHKELSSPLTTRHFAAQMQGEILGLSHTPRRFAQDWLRPRTPIEGLFLSGADVCAAGLASAFMGGAICAASIGGQRLLAVSLLGARKGARRGSRSARPASGAVPAARP